MTITVKCKECGAPIERSENEYQDDQRAFDEGIWNGQYCCPDCWDKRLAKLTQLAERPKPTAEDDAAERERQRQMFEAAQERRKQHEQDALRGLALALRPFATIDTATWKAAKNPEFTLASIVNAQMALKNAYLYGLIDRDMLEGLPIVVSA